MRLTTFTDYSLRMLIYLAAAPEQRATIAQVARSYGVSEHHMVKVVHLLGKAGLLRNTRGKGGGVQLALPPSRIRIGRVARLTEGGDVPAECFDPPRNACRIAGACRLQRALRDGVDAFYRALDRYSLEDLTIGRTELDARLHPLRRYDRGAPSSAADHEPGAAYGLARATAAGTGPRLTLVKPARVDPGFNSRLFGRERPS